jgi:rhamnosyltransferase
MSTVAVIIPVKNGMPEMKDCIEGILKQSVKVNRILTIDSGSTDGTVEYLKSIEQVQLHQIKPEEFNHGDTRNLGWQLCDEDFLLYTVQDAKAVNEYWIEKLLNGFDDDKVAGVCGQQVVPHEKDKNPLQWFRPKSKPSVFKYQFDKPEDFLHLSPLQKKIACSWDDVNAMYRGKILRQVPFQRTSFAEDAIWARDILSKGFALVYDASVQVYHYHNESPAFTFKRTFTELYYRYTLFGLKPTKPSFGLKQELSAIKNLLTENISWAEKWKWFQYNRSLKRNSNRAIDHFLEAVKKGNGTIEKMHEELCGIAPTPKQTT